MLKKSRIVVSRTLKMRQTLICLEEDTKTGNLISEYLSITLFLKYPVFLFLFFVLFCFFHFKTVFIVFSKLTCFITCGPKLLNADWLRKRAFFLRGTFGNQEGMIT